MNQITTLRGIVAGASGIAAPPVAEHPLDSPIVIEIRPLSACADIRQAWSDLAARAIEPNLFFEPDFALAASQHLVAFRDVAVILAWQSRPGDPRRRLLGLIPCFPRNRLFVPDELIGFSERHILNGAPLLDAATAEAVIMAVLSLRQGWVLQGRGFVLRRIDLESALMTPLLRAAEPLGLSATLQPAGRVLPLVAPSQPGDNAPGRQALSRRGRLQLVEAGSRIETRDAVELILAMQASGPVGRAGTAVLHDTREVGFLRAMTRALARARQCRVGLLMLDETPIAGAIVLGRARRNWLYMAAHDEAFATFTAEQVLLAMMRQSAPSRPIIEPSQPEASFGEVRLTPQAALKPRDLAARARDAFQRSFRLRRAGAAG